MRRALHFLVIVTVLMCALHIGEPAQAHDGGQHGLYIHTDLTDEDSGSDQDHGAPAKAAHAGHHHCPIAPDPRAGANEGSMLADEEILFARPVATLRSLSQAPPVEPPVA